jgi:hypothetical protein
MYKACQHHILVPALVTDVSTPRSWQEDPVFSLTLRSNKKKTVPPAVFPTRRPFSFPSTCSKIQDQLPNLGRFFTELVIKVFRNRLSSQREIRENRLSSQREIRVNRCRRFLPVVAIRISLDTAKLSQNFSLLRINIEHCTQKLIVQALRLYFWGLFILGTPRPIHQSSVFFLNPRLRPQTLD